MFTGTQSFVCAYTLTKSHNSVGSVTGIWWDQNSIVWNERQVNHGKNLYMLYIHSTSRHLEYWWSSYFIGVTESGAVTYFLCIEKHEYDVLEYWVISSMRSLSICEEAFCKCPLNCSIATNKFPLPGEQSDHLRGLATRKLECESERDHQSRLSCATCQLLVFGHHLVRNRLAQVLQMWSGGFQWYVTVRRTL